MLNIPGIFEQPTSRRAMLAFGGYNLLGTLLNQSVKAAPTTDGPVRSCVFLVFYGGPSHLDTWDMKPNAPVDIRGEYRPIRTNIPGRIVSEHLSGCAQVLDKMAIIRSMHHGSSNHNSAMYATLIGYPPHSDDPVLGINRTKDFPSYGSVINYLTNRGQIPKTESPLVSAALPHVLHNVVDLPGQNAGFLGGAFDPFQIVNDPNLPDFDVRNLTPPPEIAGPRMAERIQLLDAMERRTASAGDDTLRSFRNKAVDLMQSSAIRDAFQIDREPAAIRERYGRHKLGQSMLLARRLVESGVRFINVNDHIYNGQDANWDSHLNIFPRHRDLLLPADQALSTFITDLNDRGLLDSTLVVAIGEFGRSPRINGSAGRDHWPDCYSVVLAGGGVKAGSTYGESDRIGAFPISRPVTPADLAATMFHRLGIDPRVEVRDLLDRPFPIATGEPLRDLFA